MSLLSMIILHHRILPLDPDLLVLGITEINDLELTPFKYQSEKAEEYKKSFRWKILPVRKYLEWKVLVDYHQTHRQYIHDLYKPESKTWINFSETLTEIRDVCTERDIPLFAIIFPWIEDVDMFAKERRQIMDKVAEQLRQGGLLFVGHSETLSNIKHNFRSVGSSIYMKM